MFQACLIWIYSLKYDFDRKKIKKEKKKKRRGDFAVKLQFSIEGRCLKVINEKYFHEIVLRELIYGGIMTEKMNLIDIIVFIV